MPAATPTVSAGIAAAAGVVATVAAIVATVAAIIAAVVTTVAVVASVPAVVAVGIVITGPETDPIVGWIVSIIRVIRRIIGSRGVRRSGRGRRVFLCLLRAFAVTVRMCGSGVGCVVAAGVVSIATGKARRGESGGGGPQTAEKGAQIFHRGGGPC
jgi:hypothetical protein